MSERQSWVAYANCGNPYFICSTAIEMKQVVQNEMRYVRPRGGHMRLISEDEIINAYNQLLNHWPASNPRVQNSYYMRVEPSTIQVQVNENSSQ